MTGFELCPACLRLAHELVDQALDFTGMVTRGEMERICEQHLPLVFASLSPTTMARWLEHVLALRESDSFAFNAMTCPLCETEARSGPTDAEKESLYLCTHHGGAGGEALGLIRRQLAQIAAGERLRGERFFIRAALLFYASVRGTAAFVRIE